MVAFCRRTPVAAVLLVAACSSNDGGELDPSAAPSGSSQALPAPSGSALALPAPTSAPKAPPAPLPPLPDEDLYPDTLEEQREALFRRMAVMLRLSDEQMSAVRAVFGRSSHLGQGNPKVTQPPVTRKQCREKRAEAGVVDEDKAMCGGPFMVPLYDPSVGEKEEDAKACIDRFEFPGIPCEHPVVYPSAREAAELCAAVGKRLCDAHEWEGACAGAVHAPEDEYAFDKARKDAKNLHNRDREIVWAYGREKNHAACGTASKKTEGCTSSGWKRCGTNSFPSGSFPTCKSPLGVYDQHGNVAEHMNLPLRPEELASRGGKGWTEMKGSWFIFANFEAHEDDCRWRAPDWHATKVTDPNSHGNYHLGFRCCKTIEK
jgi:formylglycine-generating enzyme required for sulfatase activity